MTAPHLPRVALVSHCLANQNAKVAEYAICAGCVTPVLSALRDRGYLVQQMPCPEMTFLGAARWWQVRDQYDTPGYRRHCRLVAESVVQILAHHIAAGCGDLVILGVDGSPSSGVGLTDSGSSWGGRPAGHPMALVPGRGVWIEVLETVLGEAGLPRPRLFGLGTELPDFDMASDLARLDAFLDIAGAP